MPSLVLDSAVVVWAARALGLGLRAAWLHADRATHAVIYNSRTRVLILVRLSDKSGTVDTKVLKLESQPSIVRAHRHRWAPSAGRAMQWPILSLSYHFATL
eukprot:SAG11_NODE_6156_length_1375_cov_0.826019_3_plen_101_part_00